MSKAKELRGQVRQVVKEVFSDEIIKLAFDKVEAMTNERLALIESYNKESIDKQDKRARAIQGFFTNQVAVSIDNRLHNAEVTLRAWQQVIASKLGTVLGSSMEELNAAIDSKKLEIQKQIEDEAVAKQQESISGNSTPAVTQ